MAAYGTHALNSTMAMLSHGAETTEELPKFSHLFEREADPSIPQKGVCSSLQDSHGTSLVPPFPYITFRALF